MKIKCPKCGALYIYSDDFIKNKGGKVQCFKCKTFMQVGEDGSVTLEGEGEKKEEHIPQFLENLSDKGKKRFEEYMTNPDFKEYGPLAEELIEIGEYEKAVEVCEKLLSINPKSIAGKAVKARALVRLNREDEAEALIEELKGFAEGNPIVLTALVEFYKDREPQTALRFLDMLEMVEPESQYLSRFREEITSAESAEKVEEEIVQESREDEDMAVFWDDEDKSTEELGQEEIREEEESVVEEPTEPEITEELTEDTELREMEEFVSAEETAEIPEQEVIEEDVGKEGEEREAEEEEFEGEMEDFVPAEESAPPSEEEFSETEPEGVETEEFFGSPEDVKESESEIYYTESGEEVSETAEGEEEISEGEEILEEVQFEGTEEVAEGEVMEEEPDEYVEETPSEEIEPTGETEDESAVGEEVIGDVEFEVPSQESVSDETDFSDVLEEVEEAEAKVEEDETIEELLFDETELVEKEEISPELIEEEKEKKRVFPYILIGVLVLVLLIAGGGAFYFFYYEYPGNVKKAGPGKILRLSRGLFGMSVNKSLSQEAFNKAKLATFKGNYEASLENFRLSAFYNPKDPASLSMFACLLTRERKAEFEVISSLLKQAEKLGDGIYYKLSEACVDLYGGEGKRAGKILREIGSKGTNNEVFYWLLIELVRKTGAIEYADFMKEMVEASKLHPSEVALLYFKTAETLKDIYPNDAKQYYIRAMELTDAPSVKLSYATFLFDKEKDYLTAQKIVRKVIEKKGIAPSVLGEAYEIMGKIEEFQGDKISAADHFLTAFEKDNSRKKAFFKGVSLLIEMRKFERARKLLSTNVDKLGTSADYYYFMGRCDYGQGKFVPAVENLKKAISIEKKVEYMFYLAKSYIKAGGFVLAEGVISELEAMTGNEPRVKLLRSFMRVEKGEVDTAIKELKSLYPQLKRDSDFHYFLGYAYFKKGNYSLAEKETLSAWKMSSKTEYALLLARIYFNRGRYNEAIKFASLGISKSPDTPEGYVVRARSYEAKGEIRKAIRDYEKALKLAPENINLAVDYSNILMKIKEYQKAEEILKEGLKIDASDPRIYYLLGRIYYINGKLEEASSYFARAEELRPEMAEAHFYMGMIYFKEHVYNKAYEYFERAVHYESNNPIYLYYLSKVLFINNRAFDALGYIEKAVKYSPKYDDAWVLKGEIKAFLGKGDEAKRCFEKAVRLNRKNVRGWIKLAELASNEGDIRKALYYLSNAERFSRENIEVYLARGKVYYTQGEFSKALSEFRKANKINVDDPRPYYYMGLVYKKIGERNKSEEMFNKAINKGLSGKEKEELAREMGGWR